MALRVLLADESTTIKKVMQLALQDFAVEVKSVQSGVDVIEVARAFEPDVIFTDVLLQKRNGYEVTAELKKHPTLRHIPVILMWSSFMDLDEKQAQASGADRRLEKPFDVEHLRQLILELVPKTRSQRLAHFLQFPETVSEPMKQEVTNRQGPGMQPPPLPPLQPPSTWGSPPASTAPPAQPPTQPQYQARTNPLSTVTPANAASLPPWVVQPPPAPPRTEARNPLPPPTQAARAQAAPPRAAPNQQERFTPPPVAPAPPPRAPAKIEEEPLFDLASDEPASPPLKLDTQPESEAPANWSMDNFEDINDFAEKEQAQPPPPPPPILRATPKAPPTPPPKASAAAVEIGDDEDDEDYSEFRITKPASTTARPQGYTNEKLSEKTREEVPAAKSESARAPDDRDPWSHQDLQRFKVDLPPTVTDDEDGDLLSVNVEEPDPRNADFLHQRGARPAAAAPAARPSPSASQAPRARRATEPDRMSVDAESGIPMIELDEHALHSPLELDHELGDDLAAEPDLQLSTFSDNDADQDTLPNAEAKVRSRASSEDTLVPQLSAERLEEIVRAQSREVIEALVKKIVPDLVANLATELIREELHRLLDDSPQPSSPARGQLKR